MRSPCPQAIRGLALSLGVAAALLCAGCKKDVTCGTRASPKPPVTVTSPWKEVTPALTSTPGVLTCDSDARHVEGVGAAPATWSATGEAILAQLKSQGWAEYPYAPGGVPIKRDADGIQFELKKGDRRLCGYVTSINSSRLKGDAFQFHYGTFAHDTGHCMDWSGI
jgi:hypothetical protein